MHRDINKLLEIITQEEYKRLQKDSNFKFIAEILDHRLENQEIVDFAKWDFWITSKLIQYKKNYIDSNKSVYY